MYFDIIKDILGFILMIVFSGAALVILALTSSLAYIFIKACIQGTKNIDKDE